MGSSPSALKRAKVASFSASASDQDSPWLAKPLAGAGPRWMTTSSRCGPTSVIPRSSSSLRRSATRSFIAAVSSAAVGSVVPATSALPSPASGTVEE